MTIGTGIAIAGIWIFAGLSFSSSRVSGFGSLLALSAAIIITLIIL